MKIPAKCDVAVIGGGPSGSLTATYLAQAGYDVALFDKQRHPRHQVGESLIPDFWKYCDKAGVTDQILADGFVRKAGGTVDWHGTTRRIAFKDFGYTRPALHVERDRFDHLLIENARAKGVQVFEEVVAGECDFGAPRGARITCRPLGEGGTAQSVDCRIVVDASGQSAVVGRQLGVRSFDDAFRVMSVYGYFENSKYYGADGEVHPAASVHAVPPTTFVSSVPNGGDWGWCWHIMLRDCVSIGFILPMDAMKDVKASERSWEEYFLQQCRSFPRLAGLLEEAKFRAGSVRVVRDYSYRSTQVAGPGFFLVGDAAGFVDPIFSVGVVLGMYSASAAAWSIDRIFKSPERTAEHIALYTNQLQGRMEMARALALPQYEIRGSVGEEARKIVKFTDEKAKALMYAASALTGRAEHVRAMTGEPLPRTASGTVAADPR